MYLRTCTIRENGIGSYAHVVIAAWVYAKLVGATEANAQRYVRIASFSSSAQFAAQSFAATNAIIALNNARLPTPPSPIQTFMSILKIISDHVTP